MTVTMFAGKMNNKASSQKHDYACSLGNKSKVNLTGLSPRSYPFLNKQIRRGKIYTVGQALLISYQFPWK